MCFHIFHIFKVDWLKNYIFITQDKVKDKVQREKVFLVLPVHISTRSRRRLRTDRVRDWNREFCRSRQPGTSPRCRARSSLESDLDLLSRRFPDLRLDLDLGSLFVLEFLWLCIERHQVFGSNDSYKWKERSEKKNLTFILNIFLLQ